MDEHDQGIMASFEKEALSFVIRMWREGRSEHEGREGPEEDGAVHDRSEWRGWIDHVQSGKRHYFREVSAISLIVDTYAGEELKLENTSPPNQDPDA